MILKLKLVLFDLLKKVENFYNKFGECKQCNTKRNLIPYYNHKDDILQNCQDIYARFKDLDNRLTALEKS